MNPFDPPTPRTGEVLLDYDYVRRLRAVTDALRLVQEGTDASTPETIGYTTTTLSSSGPDSLYAEVSVALDIARFLLDLEPVEEAV